MTAEDAGIMVGERVCIQYTGFINGMQLNICILIKRIKVTIKLHVSDIQTFLGKCASV